MFLKSKLLVAGFVVAAGTFGHGAFAASAAPVQDDVKDVYTKKCAVCHGEDGSANTARGKRLKMKDIRSPEVQKLTPAQWTEAVLKGTKDMDGYEKELGADMCKKLADYMQELAKKK